MSSISRCTYSTDLLPKEIFVYLSDLFCVNFGTASILAFNTIALEWRLHIWVHDKYMVVKGSTSGH